MVQGGYCTQAGLLALRDLLDATLILRWL